MTTRTRPAVTADIPADVPANIPAAFPSSPATLGALLPAVRALAREAGAATLRWYRPDGGRGTPKLEVREKEDRSPVTAADQAADEIIRAGLAALTPTWLVVTEETYDADALSAEQAAGRFWLVDPLDGTKEFIHQRDEFTVNIALIEAGRPVLGVVFAPALDWLYAAAGPGTAVRCRGAGADQPISAVSPPEGGLRVVSSLSHDRPEATAAFLARLGAPVGATLKRGSSIKFCAVATGEADIYPRLGPTAEWDTGAGQAVVEAAGGTVTTLDGAPLRYGKTDSRLLNPEFVVRGRSRGDTA